MYRRANGYLYKGGTLFGASNGKINWTLFEGEFKMHGLEKAGLIVCNCGALVLLVGLLFWSVHLKKAKPTSVITTRRSSPINWDFQLCPDNHQTRD